MSGKISAFRDRVKRFRKSKKRCIIFLHLPKTGGSTVEFALRKELGQKSIPVQLPADLNNFGSLVDDGLFAQEGLYAIYGHSTVGVKEKSPDDVAVLEFAIFRRPEDIIFSRASFGRLRHQKLSTPLSVVIAKERPNRNCEFLNATTADEAIAFLEDNGVLVGITEKLSTLFDAIVELADLKGGEYPSRNFVPSEFKYNPGPREIAAAKELSGEDIKLYDRTVAIHAEQFRWLRERGYIGNRDAPSIFRKVPLGFTRCYTQGRGSSKQWPKFQQLWKSGTAKVRESDSAGLDLLFEAIEIEAASIIAVLKFIGRQGHKLSSDSVRLWTERVLAHLASDPRDPNGVFMTAANKYLEKNTLLIAA